MADDLDELLDQVERKFCLRVSVASPTEDQAPKSRRDSGTGPGRPSSMKAVQPESSVAEEIDALLEELLEEDYQDSPPLKSEQVPKGAHEEKKLSVQPGGRKCCPVFLGGSSATNGVGTTTSKRSCDQLRCTSCDFRVLMFDDSEWEPSCDYLFLRNNVPDRQKLRAKLRRSRGVRAYACQCSWFSSREPTDLQLQPQLRWVCGRHPA